MLVFRRIDTSDGSKGEVEARLPKSGATLGLRTGNPDSTLKVKGWARTGSQLSDR